MKNIFQKDSFTKVNFSYSIFAFILFLILFLIWSLIWHLIILPKSQPHRHGFRVEPTIQGSTEENFFPGNFFKLDHPHSSLSAYAVWNISREGVYKIKISCDDNGQISIDNRPIVSLTGTHPFIDGEGKTYLSQGQHFLRVQLNNVLEKGWMKIELIKPGQKSYQPIDINELNFIKLGNIETLLEFTRWSRHISLIGMIILIFPGFIIPVFRNKKFQPYLSLIIILLGLCSSIALHTASLSIVHDFTRGTFISFSNGIEQYIKNLDPAWRTRLFTNFLAAKFSFLGESLWQMRHDQGGFLDYFQNIQYTVALWTGFWFMIIGLLYIFVGKGGSILYLFGTGAALLFDYTEHAKYIYPWDMPALLIFTVFVILYANRKYWWIFALLPLGMGFKETTMVLCFSFLYCEMPEKRRVLIFGISLILCMMVKIAIDIYVQNPIPFFTMEHNIEPTYLEDANVMRNLRCLIEQHFLPLLVNGGTLLAFLILPSLNKTMRAFKIISLPFLIFILVFAGIGEYRVFFEMIPFALYSLTTSFFGKSFLDNQDNLPKPSTS
jgi:hypothetical protein